MAHFLCCPTAGNTRSAIGLLAEQAEEYGLGVLGYCLMTNHVHLLVVPDGGSCQSPVASCQRPGGARCWQLETDVPAVGWQPGADGCVLAVPGWLDLSSWRGAWSAEAWREQLRAGEDEETVANLRLSTHTGRPLGSDAFLSKLGHALGRRLRPLPVGRPGKRPGAGK